MEHSPLSLKCVVRGQVLTPTADFDRQLLDFSSVSFGFLSKRTVVLRNQSEIPLSYHVRFNDGTFLSREFAAEPAEGVIQVQERVRIRVDFIPAQLGEYKTCLFVDIGFSVCFSVEWWGGDGGVLRLMHRMCLL